MNNYVPLFASDGNVALQSWPFPSLALILAFSLSDSAHCCPEYFGQVCCAGVYVNQIRFLIFKNDCLCETMKKKEYKLKEDCIFLF